LRVLEDALERGEAVVPTTTPRAVFAAVPAIQPGTPLIDALDIVFHEQEHFLSSPATQLVVEASRMMSAEEARDLTARIKAQIDGVAELILEAHDGRAWAALGYSSWERYIKSEFGLSRSRSYELIDQARVHRTLKIATDGRPIPHVSARAAAALRPILPRVAATVQRRLGDEGMQPEDVVRDVIRETLDQLRRRAAASRTQDSARIGKDVQSPHPRTTNPGAFDVETLVSAIECLALLPSAAELWSTLTEVDRRRLAGLPSVSQRLAELEGQCEIWRSALARQGEWDGHRPLPVDQASDPDSLSAQLTSREVGDYEHRHRQNVATPIALT
jgi:hypothetical protein